VSRTIHGADHRHTDATAAAAERDLHAAVEDLYSCCGQPEARTMYSAVGSYAGSALYELVRIFRSCFRSLTQIAAPAGPLLAQRPVHAVHIRILV
jgi:hypothetical protein